MSIRQDKISLLHGVFAAGNVLQFARVLPLLTTDGFALTYPPFAAGTSLALYCASPHIRVGHALATAVVCAPHLTSFTGAAVHFGASVAYLTGWKLKYWDNDDDTTKNNTRTKIPLSTRILTGWLGLSQLGIAAYFTKYYVSGNSATYEAFLIDTLTQADKVPLSILTPSFLQGVYLAGTYAVSGIGWSIAVNLTKAVFQNSAADARAVLKSLAASLSTQVAVHTVGYLIGWGGSDLKQYMFVHGPMSAPVLAMVIGAWYLCGSVSSTDDSEKKKD